MPITIEKSGVVIRRPIDGRLLCIRQRASGFWSPAAKGSIEGNETPAQCAVREAKEELDVDVELLDAEPFHRDRAGIVFFRARILPGQIISIDRRELADFEWLTEAQLAERNVSNTTKRMLRAGVLAKVT